MPEGHTIHRLAAAYQDTFGGLAVRAESPQGRFADSAALIDGQTLTAAQAHGKNLFLGFDPGVWIHIHLGLYGKVTFGSGPAPAPVGQVRLRLATADCYADLRGPHLCALVSRGGKQDVHARLGPDPLRPDAEPGAAWARISRSRVSIAALLLDQRIVAGVGNIYRAEVLFRHGVPPYLPGRDLGQPIWEALWTDLAALMRDGVRTGRIDTVRPEHLPEAMGRPPRFDRHGGEVYVYRRARQACLVCGGEIRTAPLAGRGLYWCSGCQRG